MPVLIRGGNFPFGNFRGSFQKGRGKFRGQSQKWCGVSSFADSVELSPRCVAFVRTRVLKVLLPTNGVLARAPNLLVGARAHGPNARSTPNADLFASMKCSAPAPRPILTTGDRLTRRQPAAVPTPRPSRTDCRRAPIPAAMGSHGLSSQVGAAGRHLHFRIGGPEEQNTREGQLRGGRYGGAPPPEFCRAATRSPSSTFGAQLRKNPHSFHHPQ